MFGWFCKKKTLEEAVFERKTVTVHGIPFTIKKLSSFDYLNGSRVMLQVFDTYKVKGYDKASSEAVESIKKIQDHYRDVLMSAVVKPELTRKKGEPDKFYVDDLFENAELAIAVYQEILVFTYGKKKLRHHFPKNV